MYQDTSRTAYQALRPRLGEKQRAVLAVISSSRRDWSNTEIAREIFWPINTVTPRVKELREMGYVTLSRKRMCGVTGLTVNAWKEKSTLPDQQSIFQ